MKSDVFELARSGGRIAGDLPLVEANRLETSNREGALRWSAAGVKDKENKLYLDLEVDGEVVQVCQRCLEPVTVPIEIRRRFLLARTEDEADAMPLDADELEVVVGSKDFDLADLIEDEVILSLPLVPMHQRCPQPLLPAGSIEMPDDAVARDAGTIRLSPFASLAHWSPRSKN